MAAQATLACSSAILLPHPKHRKMNPSRYQSAPPSPFTSINVTLLTIRSSSRYFPIIAAATSCSGMEAERPIIELEFVDSQARGDGDYGRQMATAVSGEKLLRSVMIENKIELYGSYGKVMNCGGGGSCGTCIVEIVDGQHLLNERTDTEHRYLKKRPGTWRLACQTIVGNKDNSGKVIVQRLPQWKK